MWCQAHVTGLSGLYLHICFPFVSFDELFTAHWNDSGDHWWLLLRVDGCLFLFFVIIPFFPWFSIKFPPPLRSFPRWQQTKKKNILALQVEPFHCITERRPLFCCRNDYSVGGGGVGWLGGAGGAEGEKRDQMEKYCGHKYAGPPPRTPPTHRANEPKHTHSSWPIKRLE